MPTRVTVNKTKMRAYNCYCDSYRSTLIRQKALHFFYYAVEKFRSNSAHTYILIYMLRVLICDGSVKASFVVRLVQGLPAHFLSRFWWKGGFWHEKCFSQWLFKMKKSWGRFMDHRDALFNPARLKHKTQSIGPMSSILPGLVHVTRQKNLTAYLW